MLIKCAFNSIVFCNAKSPYLLHVKCSKPALILFTDVFGVRYAGHSKWQNIKKTKETNDQAKCRNFNALIGNFRREVLKGGSTDPKLNPKIAALMKQGHSISMPLTTMNNILKRFESIRNNPKKYVSYFKSSDGVIFLVQFISDYQVKTRGEINSLFRKFNIKKADEGVRTAFEIKGNVVAKPPTNTAHSFEKTVEDAIEVGAEEVEPVEDSTELLKFVCDVSELPAVQSKLESKSYVVETSEELYIPRSPVELEDDQYEKLDELIQKLEELPEVEKIISNVA